MKRRSSIDFSSRIVDEKAGAELVVVRVKVLKLDDPVRVDVSENSLYDESPEGDPINPCERFMRLLGAAAEEEGSRRESTRRLIWPFHTLRDCRSVNVRINLSRSSFSSCMLIVRERSPGTEVSTTELMCLT